MANLDSARFQFIADALDGTGGFRTGDALVRYPRESDEKFARRKAMAWYAHALRPACQRFVGYIAKRPVYRDLSQPALAASLTLATGRTIVLMCSGAIS